MEEPPRKTARVVGPSAEPTASRDRSSTHASNRKRSEEANRGRGRNAEQEPAVQDQQDDEIMADQQEDDIEAEETSGEEEEEEAEEDVGADIEAEFEEESGDEDDENRLWYQGGPFDLCLLTKYGEHIARDIWRSYKRRNYETRGVLKTYNHGRMCHHVVHHARYIRGAVHDAGLRWVMKCTSLSVDQSIISAFVERWHPETSSFHLPWGK
ncbi:uncharacterized protein LOC130743887 [Lotus japonicus]|uniref:uncharacterized protein LOC130743887 n=1 Tax=Lotus japonicus TaxID=34305 RepID=UPI00258AB661|nr:uncharacterized protein LOC130743887 [Lotus japonicus]